MKYKRRNLIFLFVIPRNFSHPRLGSKPTDDIVSLQDLQLLVLENKDNLKPPKLLVIKDDRSRL